MSRKKFTTLGIASVLFLLFLSCNVNLLGGPFTEAKPENEDHENNDFEERGFRVWIDGPSLYERGLMRVIAEDFGDGSMPGKGDEELKTRTKGYFTSKSSDDRSDYPVVWNFDWYGKPLRKGRMIFEPAIAGGRGHFYRFLLGGISNTIGLRLIVPLDESVSGYEALRLITSGTSGNTLYRDLTVQRSDFATDVEPRLTSENYFRFETVGGQKRADMLFNTSQYPNLLLTINDLYKPSSLRPPLYVFDQDLPSAYFFSQLITINAFGLTGDAWIPPNPNGDLNFHFLDASSTEVGSYSLSEEQVLFLRNIFLGFNESSNPPNVLFQTYHNRQSYETGTQVLDGITYQTASVRRSGPDGKSCLYRAMVAGLATVSDETDDELRLEVDRCLIGPVTHANTWDQVLDDIFSVQVLAAANNDGAGYHMTRAMIKAENVNQAFSIQEKRYVVHFKYPWLVGVPGQATLRAMLRMFRKGNYLRIKGNSTDITGTEEGPREPNALGIALQPSLDTLLNTQTRKALVSLFWPISELNKIRDAFNP